MTVLKKVGLVTAFLFALACAVLLGLDWYFPPDLNKKEWATIVTARDGTPLRAFADKNGEWRYPTSPDMVSPLYLEALMTYEDQWFYYHPGVNPFAMARALVQNLTAGKIVSGGSTLTMQVARLITPVKRNLAGKCLQILRALQLEWHLTKDEILSLYINLAPFGANIEGVQTACFSWLGKDASELSHAEAALMAVLPQAPSFYRPDRHPKRAQKARDKVLDRMKTFGVWSGSQVAAAKMEPVAARRFTPPMTAPLAARRLKSRFPGKSHIQTTIDYDLQLHAQDIVMDYVSQLGSHQSAAALVVNHRTLEILVYVGSADFLSIDRQGHVDMVRAIRSPGSTLKPFLYGLALDEGLIHSHSMLLDIPRYQEEYDPGNFSQGFSGPVTVAQALRLSLNVPAVQVLAVFGPQTFHDRLVHAGARIRMSGKPNLSIILGGTGTSLESLVTLYTAIARQGVTGRPALLRNEKKQERFLISPGAAWIIRQILAQPTPGMEGVNRLAEHIPLAWKTGTSYGFRDAWALGIMGDYVAGVWVGRPDGSPSIGQYGAVTAIPLLKRILDSMPLSDFTTPPPESVTAQTICWPLGLQEHRTGGTCHVRHQAWILDNKTPLTLNRQQDQFLPLRKTFWVDDQGKRAAPSCGGINKISIDTWPTEAHPFIPRAWHLDRLVPPPSEKCPDLARIQGSPMQITSIADNSILSSPTGNPAGVSIPLSVLGSHGKTYWFLNRRPVASLAPGTAGTLPLPPPGAYQLSAADETGNFDVINFQVMDIK